MCRRDSAPFNGHRYIGDKRQKVVHDLDHEDKDVRGCRISDIAAENIVTFEPDTLHEAYRHGYEFCRACIGE